MSSIRLITAALLATAMTAPASVDADENGSHYGWYKKGKKKESVVVPEPPMIVLLGTGLVVLGLAGWRKRRKL
jgi:hypothetical protein